MKQVHTTNALRAGWVAIGAAAVLVAGAYGCSSSSSGDDSASGGDGGSGDGATGTGDGGSGKAYSGFIAVNQTDKTGMYSGSLGAQFFKTQTPPPGTPTCTKTTSGSCTFSDCTAVIAGYDGGGPQNIPAQVGTLSISGGKLAAATTLTYYPSQQNAALSAYNATTTSQIFAAGDTLTATATGQDVAAFTGTSGPAPADIALTAPTGTAGVTTVYTIDESKDLAVTWTGGSAGSQVQVLLANKSEALQLECNFDAAGGTGTVPTALLTQLGPNDGTFGGANGISAFSVTPQTTVPISVSNADVKFQVFGTAITGMFKTP